MKYFSINLYRKMLDCAIEEGMTREDFMYLPTPINAIDDLQVIPAEEFLALHEMLAVKLGRGYPIRVGQKMIIEDYGVLGLSWRTCSRVGEIFERSKRYFKLLSNTFLWEVEDHGTLSRVRLDREAHRWGMELSTEASLSATVVVLQAMSEQNIMPTLVTFKHSAPEDLREHNKAFQCPILFNQTDYSITYKTEDLNLRTGKADSTINSYLVKQVEEKTKGIKIPGNSFVRDVEDLIKDALPTGIPSIHNISDLLAMSNRTLTRRLSEAGVTFRDLIKKTQYQIAKDMLRDPSNSIGDIAFITGFSDQSAFNRAFKKWSGLSPSNYKKRL
ncbi:MAG: AraC family transcriptional regulator ligand-binding domain-containing protein [Bacteroidota bacterium]